MWKGRHTPIRSELDFVVDPHATAQDEPLRERTVRAGVDQLSCRERRRRAKTGRWRSHRTETTVNELTRTYRQKVRQAYSKLKPTHEEVVTITDRESYVSSSRTAKTRHKVTPRGALTEAFLDRQSAKGRVLLRDWKQGGHGWLSDRNPTTSSE